MAELTAVLGSCYTGAVKGVTAIASGDELAAAGYRHSGVGRGSIAPFKFRPFHHKWFALYCRCGLQPIFRVSARWT